MTTQTRVRSALSAAFVHLSLSIAVALGAAALVFGLWYPFPYRELSGGRELFLLVIVVDVICGPILTAVIFNPAKPRGELWRDLALVAFIQLSALGYGLQTVWEARPLFLVLEIDRFKVVGSPDLTSSWRGELAPQLKPNFLSGPVVVAIRAPKDDKERETVMFESLQGGRDFAQRPEFYLPYEGANAVQSLNHARPLTVFLQKQPSQRVAAAELAEKKGADMSQWMYLPVIARQDWIAILDKQGQIQGFLKGDGF
jgi:hypothetical protein